MKTVYFDIDTQIDFLYPAGALYVPGSEALVERIASLNRGAAARNILVVSTADAHSEDDVEFKAWPHHCVAGALGQSKPLSTLLEKRMAIPNAPRKIEVGGVQQIVLEKQTTDCFTNVNIQALLTALNADRYVVYGVVTEICVKNALMGLLATGRRVELVTDAVKELNAVAAAEMIAAFQAQGGFLTTCSTCI